MFIKDIFLTFFNKNNFILQNLQPNANPFSDRRFG